MADGARVILDAGTGLRALGQTLSRDAPMAGNPPLGVTLLLTLLLTHRHSDHVSGLAHFAPLLSRSHSVRVACGGVSAAALGETVTQQLSPPLFPALDGVTSALLVQEFDATEKFTVSATCHVTALAAFHPGGASVLRVHDASGAVFAYAPDSELSLADQAAPLAQWRARLAEALRGIPLLVHDATYIHDELAAHRGWGHSSAEDATRFAIDCGAGALLLTHHHPDRTDDEIDGIVVRCRALAAAAGSTLLVSAAAEGMVLDVT